MINNIKIGITITNEKNIEISNGDKKIIIDNKSKSINAKDIYDLLNYNIDNDYIQPKQKLDETSEESTDTRRLFNYTIDLIDNVVKEVNIKSEALRLEKEKLDTSEIKNEEND
ncbi:MULTISPECIES: hypothetical protein [Bacillota]|uniref:Uncharacterized protein n=1 Tax=Amedibacillus hominis TaxID=2897776 RepID=A0ABS9R8Q1_9FIRM|nr:MULTISPECIES: hypothetical protein [Bacillota]MCH4286042.1 hypothetical protein [Amedibacillus hominis]RGB51351.1 hypothetical protein DW271_15100 [Absiella sp. AM22-9]RGB52221.1 hypothetical protein DW120_20240 [Absiella sp. AM10-20]RGB65694.1 hypothetical protein DW113_11565 [Absiella sp. AM09-45]RGB76083.1 hypothetical protein DW114_09960 [Absiella sp. AM09-50]